MIKLLWNTHNLNIPDPNNKSYKDTLDYNWGIYHKKNSDKWIFNILEKIEFKSIENEENLESKDILIIVDSGIEKKENLYKQLKLICSRMYLIHLGDETGAYNFTSIYNNFDFVWRPFCLGQYFNNKEVNCIPIGYKTGVFLKEQKRERKYKWAFIGTPHRSSRHDILFQFSNIKPSFLHKTNKFNEKIIEVEKMSEILSSTEFLPCPNGFFHPETYRVYEALECECIPIVENAFKYYDRLFPNNPFIKVDKWIDGKLIVKEWKKEKVNQKRNECKIWWSDYKSKLQQNILKKINL